MKDYFRQFLATVLPAGYSIHEALTGGNLVLATVAAGLAIAAGRWALRKQRTQAENAELEKQILELKLQRELDRDRTGRNPPT